MGKVSSCTPQPFLLVLGNVRLVIVFLMNFIYTGFHVIEVPTPAEYHLPYEELTLETVDGVKIRSYLLMASPSGINLDASSLQESNDSVREVSKHISSFRHFCPHPTFDGLQYG